MISDFRFEYRWLSNYHLVDIPYNGLVYPSTENAYQATKTLGDRSPFTSITPLESRLLGKTVPIRPEWDFIRISVMLDVTRIKFRAGSELSQKLLDTGDQPLVECNTWGDRFWGISDGIGENWLGQILMEVRDELREDLSQKI